jgi:hypothetical protein
LIANEGFVERVPYPDIQTIYPPVTQLFFFIHHVLAPWDLDVWRAMLLIDAPTLLLLLKLLTALKKSRALVMIYGLNPLLITETMNAGHMDVLLLPFLGYVIPHCGGRHQTVAHYPTPFRASSMA